MTLDATKASSRILDDYPILLATIRLPDGKAYACDQREAVTSRGQSYLPGLVISRPQDDGKPAECAIEIANVGNRIANLVEIMDRTVPIDLELVWASAPDTVFAAYPGLVIRSAEVPLVAARFSLVQDVPVDEPVSGIRATAQHFPGLEYGF
ncbi:hypothetical protein SAMN02983003_3180 [Devosia enhydra]|uniref:DUF1833 domain-containing protein n=1 Tax=Devosia enhydra TaxID=665118 RepID=A0A1K2I111_9HYPH|nr:hypothetical protein [Devosia enhydra]SFZ86008.1 hypothetical protein SAMN02983003_3180 [Devosia enhydra]